MPLLTYLLTYLPTGSTIFFANTHGPLSGCSTSVGDNWLRAVAQLVQI